MVAKSVNSVHGTHCPGRPSAHTRGTRPLSGALHTRLRGSDKSGTPKLPPQVSANLRAAAVSWPLGHSRPHPRPATIAAVPGDLVCACGWPGVTARGVVQAVWWGWRGPCRAAQCLPGAPAIRNSLAGALHAAAGQPWRAARPPPPCGGRPCWRQRCWWLSPRPPGPHERWQHALPGAWR